MLISAVPLLTLLLTLPDRWDGAGVRQLAPGWSIRGSIYGWHQALSFMRSGGFLAMAHFVG